MECVLRPGEVFMSACGRFKADGTVEWGELTKVTCDVEDGGG